MFDALSSPGHIYLWHEGLVYVGQPHTSIFVKPRFKSLAIDSCQSRFLNICPLHLDDLGDLLSWSRAVAVVFLFGDVHYLSSRKVRSCQYTVKSFILAVASTSLERRVIYYTE